MENPVLVHQEIGSSQGTSHPWPAERDSRQAIQTWPDHSNRMVPSPRSVLSYMLPVAPASSGLICHQIQQQTPTVCVTGPRPPGLGSGCTQPVLGKFAPICLPTSSHLGQSGGEVTGLPLQQDHFERPRVAQHALVLGSSGNVQSDPSVSAQPAQSGISTIQLDPAQEPVNLHAWLLEPQQSRSRGSLRQWQHELRLLNEDQPDPSMRQSGPFLQSGASVIRWTSGLHL